LQPLDVGYFLVLKKHLLSLANGLGYASRRTLPVFPYLIKHTLTPICPANVAAAFSATGIHQFNTRAVKALTAKAKQNTSLSQSDNPIVDSNNNILVKLVLCQKNWHMCF